MNNETILQIMKKLRIIAVILLNVVLCCYSCKGGKEDPVPAANDVRFEVPSTVTLPSGARTMDFKVLFSKPPKSTDLILLGDPAGTLHECAIVKVDDSSFTIRLFDGMTSGTYNVYLQSGSVKKHMGQMKVSYSSGQSGDTITPASGVTVYGKVFCGDEGIPGVVVSDGVEVVVTDSKGIYQIKSAKKYGYVFISIPGDYEAMSEGFLPVFWQGLVKLPAAPERVDFELVKAASEDFTMYIMGDMHLAKRTNDLSQFSEFASDLNATLAADNGRKYGLTLGDMTWDLYWYSNSFSFGEYISLMNSKFKGFQVFHTMGNHDNDMERVGDFDKEIPYRNSMAPTFYSYNIGKIHFIVMDDIDYNNVGTGSSHRGEYVIDFTADQAAWLAKDLSHVDKATPVVLSTHAPVYRPTSSLGFAAGMSGADAPGELNTDGLEKLLSGYTVHFFTGHTHRCFNYDRLSTKKLFEHNAGSVCGSWWWSGYLTPGITLAQDGAPGGYTILSVKGTDMEWVYKSTGHDVSYQFNAYDMNEVKKVVTSDLGGGKTGWEPYVTNVGSYPGNTVLLNVWNWDPSWKITVTENGKSLSVKQVWQYDPLHMIAMTAKRFKATDNPNFTTSQYHHFFQVQASGPATTLEIKVTDRFGNEYSETMKRPKAFSTDAYK